MDEQSLKNWLASERKSIEAAIDSCGKNNDFDMVAYEYSKLNEIKIVESFISKLK